ncbi:hypothetical protein BHE74_00046499 [Ensete ventricosum]|nr:hypothetical protein BHE74_00046499 [Ensete ventricosum]
MRASNNGDAASRGGDWRGATIVTDDGCDCGEEVGQRWIRQLAVTVVAMQGKEGTTESKGRRGCSDSDSKEAAIGKKGEEERWQRQLRQRHGCAAATKQRRRKAMVGGDGEVDAVVASSSEEGRLEATAMVKRWPATDEGGQEGSDEGRLEAARQR